MTILAFAKKKVSAPETAQTLTFNVQIEESALRRAAVYSENAGVSLNSFIAQAVEEKLIRIDEAVRRQFSLQLTVDSSQMHRVGQAEPPHKA